ncbi:MAG: bifunctional glutamate N-acetyltransferase/amino-acid acetyltransferase ArgJ [Desulfobacterales bacterium]|nr:bifunctional glutamate N-acetyltransferase/amino-acid acetyltransferase ArgJ [Desulfobacterales bacterium]
MQVPGFLAAAGSAGLNKKREKDLGIIFSRVPATVAGVFTRNLIKAAPVLLDMERIHSGRCQAIVANSGNANACTGDQGMKAAKAVARATADALQIDESLVMVASTGVIGKVLETCGIEAALGGIVRKLDPSGLPDVSHAIMTTDKVPKIVSRKGSISGKEFTVTAMTKGAGMIRPDMATMLCFVCTDIAAPRDILQESLTKAVNKSFNIITIDGDTSTNDTVLLLANGLSGITLNSTESLEAFQDLLDALLIELARMIVRDGEGATKLININVEGGATTSDAFAVAATVADSTLVKTAIYGEDANWGRILAAAGRAGVPLSPAAIDIYFDDICMAKSSQGMGAKAEAAVTEVLKKDEFTITIDLNAGKKKARVITCDLSLDYVRINADYRT